MRVEVITTGTELLLGEILNTNFTWLAQELNRRGFDVLYQTTVGDNPARMKEVLDIAVKRADVIITSGGLGPTRGDITKEMIADYCGVDMYMNLEVWNHIHELLSRRNICIAENNEKQALVPSGAVVLHNEAGTAPGLVLEQGDTTFVMLPGPPFELKTVCEKELFPYFEQRFPHLGIIKSHTLKLRGIGESNLAEKLDDIIINQTNPTIALYARHGEILVRLTAKAPSAEKADALIAGMQEKVEKVIGTYVYGYDDDTLPEVLGKELLCRQQTIAFAESCTGGLASSMMTDVPGSSEYVKGSVISYTDEVKNQVIHVSKTTLAKKGAVSEETAVEMARGVREAIGSDMAVSITGLAGPGGGTRKKPVGLVYIAVADANGELCRKYNFGGTRSQIKHRAAMAALSFALDRLKESPNNHSEETIHDHDTDR
ncbi:MAG TPA: competence/damage-inducible protein A [Acidaminococcaceae bacterium]|nr:competence/damage-inducible protein A [Acidaminococcaceae bacterium]